MLRLSDTPKKGALEAPLFPLELRLVYGVLYITDRAKLRSVVWFAALGCVLGLFVSAA